MSELLEVNHVSYAYHSIDGETETLADISFHIKEGEFAAIVGPSGCGKSTLLSLICGLLKPEKGEILLDGKSIAGEKERIGYMLQKDYLFEWRSIYSNVMLGLEIQKKKSEKYTKRVDQMLKDYGLWDLQDHQRSESLHQVLCKENGKSKIKLSQTLKHTREDAGRRPPTFLSCSRSQNINSSSY